ncbi:PAS domain-containing protein [Myxococcota bacterium]|nr:PAS domain-containing protein [Myxococcota bacterium]
MRSVGQGLHSMLLEIPIRGLLVLGFLLAGLLPVMVGALVSFKVGRGELKKEAFHKLEAVRAIKRDQIEKFFRERLADVRTLAADPSLQKAYSELRASAAGNGTDVRLLKGQDRGRFEAPVSYRLVHDRHIGFLTGYIREQGYYDLLLLDENGLACFSVEKEEDFGADHAAEASALGDAWRAVRTTGAPFLTDMKLYAPSKGVPSQFVAAPITGPDGSQGVLVLQVSIDSIDAVMGRRDGMGETEESYLVGQDHRLRSDSVLDPVGHSVVASFRGTPEKNGVTTPAAKAALGGESGTTIIKGYRGRPVLSAFAPVAVGGTNWAVVVEIEEREIDRKIDRALSGSFMLILGISAAAVLLLALLVSALIARHLKTLSFHFEDLTEDVLAGQMTTYGDPEGVGPDFRGLVTRTNELISAFVSRMDGLPVPVLMMDVQRRLCFVNTAAAELCGLEREALIGHPCCESFRCADCGSECGCPATRAMDSDRMLQGETTLKTAHGEIPISYSSSPVRHPDGHLLGAWQVFQDLSETRRMAIENRRLENHLFRAQRLEALGTMASGIAHDFNNILSTMLVYVDLAGHDLAPESPSSKNLDQINMAIERAAEIVRQMLVFSRQMEGRHLHFDAAAVVRDTIGLFSASLPGTMSVHEEAEDAAFHLEGDPTHLGQVVMNLCANARDAMKPDGGVILVKLAVLDLHSDLDSPGLPSGLVRQKYVRLSVSDAGCGMDANTQEHLFEPFFTTKPPGQGTGLGLAVVHGIVTTWGGALAVRSAPGAGTSIDVFLPQSQDPDDTAG